MGYYTDFKLTVEGDHFITDEMREMLDEVSTYDWSDDLMMNGKWYPWEVDMRLFSQKFPGVLFKLHGEGEESGDIWEAYFKDGKAQMCRAVITFEEFDESKLK
jgi:two-component SAPR family response regulator